MAYLTEEQILASEDLTREEVDVPEWGGKVLVRTMRGFERDSFEQSMIESRGKDKSVNMRNVRARLAALTICNEKGERVFSDAKIQALGEKSASALDRVFEVAQRLNGMGKKDVEELVKN